MSDDDIAVEGLINVEAAEEALPSGEDEFDEPSAEDSDADSSDEEDGADDEFEADGFVVDEAEAEEGEEEEDSIKKRRRKKRVREHVPDEEDLDLLEEHGVVVRTKIDFAAMHC